MGYVLYTRLTVHIYFQLPSAAVHFKRKVKKNSNNKSLKLETLLQLNISSPHEWIDFDSEFFIFFVKKFAPFAEPSSNVAFRLYSKLYSYMLFMFAADLFILQLVDRHQARWVV